MAEDQDKSQKTEEPTEKKLADAREKGQVAQSREVSNFMMAFAATLLLALAMPRLSEYYSRSMQVFFERPHSFAMDPAAVGDVMFYFIWQTVLIIALPLFVFCLVAIASSAMQNSIVFSVELIKPKLEKISLISGFKRLFSLKSIVEFFKNIFKIFVASCVGIATVWPARERMMNVSRLDLPSMLKELNILAVWMLGAMTAAIAVLALVDFLYQRFEFTKQHKMSKKDIEDEQKQTDGDPKIKQRLRQLRMEKSRQRMMADVPASTVVITNPTHFAVALLYDHDAGLAPKVVAKGTDLIALKIREIAKEHDVPIVENPPLARTLYASVDIGAPIQSDHYQAVAEVISYVFQLQEQKLA